MVIEGIEAGIKHDLGSGSNVDVCKITRGGVKMYRNIKVGASRVKPPIKYKFPNKNTRISFLIFIKDF